MNDHVQLVTVTGGTLTLNSDASKVPYTKEFLDAAFDGKAPTQTDNQSVDLAKAARQSGHPLRIAVQKVSGKWYPSLMYTVLAAEAQSDGLGNPSAADAIAPLGAGSADDAVRQLITAFTKKDYRSAIALLDPNEDPAMHDYGNLLLRHAPQATDERAGGPEEHHVHRFERGWWYPGVVEERVSSPRTATTSRSRSTGSVLRSPRVRRPRRCARCRPWRNTAPTCI